MNAQLAMILRYVFSMLLTTASQKGWLHVADVDSLVNTIIDAGTQVVAFAPVAWAYFKVNNTRIREALSGAPASGAVPGNTGPAPQPK